MLPLPHGAVWQLLFVIASMLLIQEAHSHDRVVCYYTNWSVYRPGTAKFNPQNINPYLCTHLIYAFGGFTKDNTMKPFDKYQDVEQGGYTKFTGLKSYNKQLKTMLAIGGWNEGSSRFSPLVASADRRQQFIKNILKFLRQNHFDGLDLDWEYPAYRDGGKSRDKDNYAQFVQELRSEFDRESSKTGRPRLLLTMAVPAGTEYIGKGYDIPKLNKYLDWFNILSYDYHSAYEPSVNHHSPLYSLEEESEYNYDAELNIDHTIKFYLEAGAEKSKLVLGIPTYGRSYTLINEDDTEIGAPSDGPGEQGDATREKGYLAYYEICQSIRDDPDWTVVQPNSKAMGPYAYRGNQWVGYDDEAIVRKKSEYVADNGLGGIMFWSIDNDDFRGSCSGKPYPLIEAAKQALFERLGLSDNEVTRPNKNRKPSRSRSRQGSSNSNKVVEDNLLDAPKKGTKRPSSRRKTTSAPVRTTTATTTTSRRRIVGHTTTPEPPTTPDPGSDFKCEEEGFFSHPRDCKKYFWCLDSGPSNLGIVAHQFTCPSGLYFNTAADSCDFTRNVLCKKTPKTIATTAVTTERTTPITTTTNSPRITAATSRNSFLRRTTTTNAPIEEEEEDIEYEDEDDDTNDAKNSNRASDPEEDPKVIKELIELIKKLGGIEELEKQLQIQEDGSMVLKNGETQEISTTPSSISKSLYAKVLSRPNNFNSLRGRFGVSRSSVTSEEPVADVTNEEVVKSGRKTESKYTSVVRNSRPSPQNDGIDQLSEFEGFLKEKPKYVTINRTRPTLASVANTNDDESLLEIEENSQVERSDADLDSVVVVEEKITSRPTTPSLSYVNIRRTRPTTSSTEKFETTESSEELVSKLTTSIKTQNNAIITTTRVDKVPLTEPTEESVSIGATRTPYKAISRTRGTTSAPDEEEITASTITLSNRYKTIERTRPTRFSKTEDKLTLVNQNTSDEGEDANVTVQNLDTEYTTTTTTQKPIQTTTSRIYANIGRRTTTSTIPTTTTIPSAASTETQTPEYIAPEYLSNTVNTSTVTPIHSILSTLPEPTTPQSSDQFPKHEEFPSDTTTGSIPVTDAFLNTEEHDTTETYKATDDSTTTTTIGDQVTRTTSRFNYSGNIDSKVKLTNLNTKTQSSLNISGIRLSDVDSESHQLTKNLTDTLTNDQTLTSTTETVDNIDTEFLGTISSPRPFGFPRRRTRPTTTKRPVTNHEITTTNTGYDKTDTDQNKVSPFKSFNVATTKGKTVSRYSNNESIVSNNNYVDNTNYGEQKLGPVEESLSHTTTHSVRLLKDSIPKTNNEPLEIGPPKPTYSWRSMVNRNFRPFKSTTSDPSVIQSSSNFNTPSVSRRRRPYKIDDSSENNSNDINTAETRGGRLPNSYSDLDSRKSNTATVPSHNVRPTRPASKFVATQSKQNIRSRDRLTSNKVLEESSNINTSSITDETQGLINKDNRGVVEDNDQHNQNLIPIIKESISNKSTTIEDNSQDIDSNEHNINLHFKSIALDKKNSSISTNSTSKFQISTGVIDGNENVEQSGYTTLKPHLEDSITTTDSKDDITLKATDSSSLTNTKHNATRNSGPNIKRINASNRSRNITSEDTISSTTTDSKDDITLKTTGASRLANTKHNETRNSVPNIRRINASNHSKIVTSEDSISPTTTEIKVKTTDAFSLRNTKHNKTHNGVPNITRINASDHSSNITSEDSIYSTTTDSKADIILKTPDTSSLRNTKHNQTLNAVTNLKPTNASDLNITQSAFKLEESDLNRLDVKSTSISNQVQNNGENSSLEKEDSSTLNPNENPIVEDGMTTISSNLYFSENATNLESKLEIKEIDNDFNRQENIGQVNDEILISTTTESIKTLKNENISRSSNRKDEKDSYSVEAFDKSKNDRGEHSESAMKAYTSRTVLTSEKRNEFNISRISTGSPGKENTTPSSGQYQIINNETRGILRARKENTTQSSGQDQIEKATRQDKIDTTEAISKYENGSEKSVKLEDNEHDLSNTLKTSTVELDTSEKPSLQKSISNRNESNITEISPSESTTDPPAMAEDDDIKFNPFSITNAHVGFEPGRYVVRKRIRKRPMKKQNDQNRTISANTSKLVNLSDTNIKQIENNDTQSLEEHNRNIQNNTGNNIRRYGVKVNNTNHLSFSGNSEIKLNVGDQNNQLYGRSRGREQQNITSSRKVFENSSRTDNLTLKGANTSSIASQQFHTGSNVGQKAQFEVNSTEINLNQRQNFGSDRSKSRSGIGIEIQNKHKISEAESERNGNGEIVVNTDSNKFQNNSSDSTNIGTKEGSILGFEHKNKEIVSDTVIDVNGKHKIQLNTDTQKLQPNFSDSTIIKTKDLTKKDIVSETEVVDNEKFKIRLDIEKLKSNSSGSSIIESKEEFKDIKYESRAENEKVENQLNIDTKELQNNSSESTLIGITEERISQTEIKNEDIVSDVEANSKKIDEIQLNLDTNKLQKTSSRSSINGTIEESIPKTEIKNKGILSEVEADISKISGIEVNIDDGKLNNKSSDSAIIETKEKIIQEDEIKKIDILSESEVDSNKTIEIQLNIDNKNKSESNVNVDSKKLQNNSSDSTIIGATENTISETEIGNKDVISATVTESNKTVEIQINLDSKKLENNSSESQITGSIDENIPETDSNYNEHLQTSHGEFSNTRGKVSTSRTHIRNETGIELNNHTDTVVPSNKSQNTGIKETIRNTSNFSRNQKTDSHINLDNDKLENNSSERHISGSTDENIHEKGLDYNDNLETSHGKFSNTKTKGSTSRTHIRNQTGIELNNHTDTVILPKKSQSTATKETFRKTSHFSRNQNTDSHIKDSKNDLEYSSNLNRSDGDLNLNLTDIKSRNSKEKYESTVLDNGPVRENGEIHIKKLSTNESIHETDPNYNDNLETSQGKFSNTRGKAPIYRTHIRNETGIELNNHTDTIVSSNKSESAGTIETVRNASNFSRNQKIDSHINLDNDKLENNSSEIHISGSTDENIHENGLDYNDNLETSHGKFSNTTTKGSSTYRIHIRNQTGIERNNHTDTVISPNKSQITGTKETFQNTSHFSRNQNTDSHIKDSKNDSEYSSNLSHTDEVLKPNLTDIKSRNSKEKYESTVSDSGPEQENSETHIKKISEEHSNYRNTITTNRSNPLTKSSLSLEETTIKQSESEDNDITTSSQKTNAPERKLRPGYEDDLSSLLAADFLKYKGSKGSNNSSRRRIIPSRRPVEIDRKSHNEDTNSALQEGSTSQTGFTQRRRISISGSRNKQLNNVTSDNKTIIGHNSESNKTSETTNESKGETFDEINTDKNFINHTEIVINGEDETTLNLTSTEKIIGTDKQLEGRNETNQIPSRSKSEYGKVENKSNILDESNVTVHKYNGSDKVKTLGVSDEEYGNNEEYRTEHFEEFSTEILNRKNNINLEKSDITEKNVSGRTRGRQHVSIKTSSVDDTVTISTDPTLERKLRPEIESDLSSLLAGDFLKYKHSRNNTSRRIIPNRKPIQTNVTDKVENDLKSIDSELANVLQISEKPLLLQNETKYRKLSVQNNTAINSSQDTSVIGHNIDIKTESINRISLDTETANIDLEEIKKNLTEVSNSSNINDIENISEACKNHNNSQIDLSNCTSKEIQNLENESSIQLSQINTTEFSSIQEKQLNGTDTVKNTSNISEKSTTENDELNSLEEKGILNNVSVLNGTEVKQNGSKTKLHTIHRQGNTKGSEITEDNRSGNFKISASNTSHRNELNRISTSPNKNLSSTIEKNTFKETRGRQHITTENEITEGETISDDKFIERKLRPGIESDLSSLLAVDIKNSSSRRRIIPKTTKNSLNATKITNFQLNLNKDNVTTEIDKHSRNDTDLFPDLSANDTSYDINVTISKNTSQVGDTAIEVDDTRNQQESNELKNKTSPQELYPIFYRNKIENASGLRYKSLYRGKDSNGSLDGILDNTVGNNSYSINYNSTKLDGTINNLYTTNENTTSIDNKTLLNQKRFGLKSPHLEDGSAAFFSLVAENRAPDKNASTKFLLNNTISENSSEINSFFPFTTEYIDDTSTTNIPDIENVDSSTLTADLENYDNSISTLYENESSTLSNESIDDQTTTNPITSDLESGIHIKNKLKQEKNDTISGNLTTSEVNSKLKPTQPSLNYSSSNTSTDFFKNDAEKSNVKFFRKTSEITRPPDVVNSTVYPTTPSSLRSFNRIRINNKLSLNTSNTFSDKSSNITASLGNASNATSTDNALSESTNNIISEPDEISSEKKEPEISSGPRRKVLFRRPTEKSLSARSRQNLNLTQSTLKKIESSNTESEDTAEGVIENSSNERTTDAGELIRNTTGDSDRNLPPKRTYSVLNRTKSEGKLSQTNRYRGRLSSKANTTGLQDVIENSSNEVTTDATELITNKTGDSNLPPKRTYSVLNRSQSEANFKQSNRFRGRLNNKTDTPGLQDAIENNSNEATTDAGEIITSTVSDDSESNVTPKRTYSILNRTKSEGILTQTNRYRGRLSNKTDTTGPQENDNIGVDEQSTNASITDDNDNEGSTSDQTNSLISNKYGVKNSTNASPFSRFSDSKRRLTLKDETLSISSPSSTVRNNFKISTDVTTEISNKQIFSTRNKNRFRIRNKAEVDENENTTTSNETEQKPEKEALNTTKPFSRSRVASTRIPYKKNNETKIDSNATGSNDSSTSTYSKYNAISRNPSLQKNNTLETNSTDAEQTDEVPENENKILENITLNSKTRFSERKTSFFRKPKLLSVDKEDKEVNKTDVDTNILNTVNSKGNDSFSEKQYNGTKILPEKALRNGTLRLDTSEIVENKEEGKELNINEKGKNGSRVKIIRKLKTKTQVTTTESNDYLSSTEVSEVVPTVDSIIFDTTTSTISEEEDEYINTTENPDISEQTEYDISVDKFLESGVINDVTELPTLGIKSETDFPYNSAENNENTVEEEEQKEEVENYDVKNVKSTSNVNTTRSATQSKSFKFSTRTRITTTPRTTNEIQNNITARQHENKNNAEEEDGDSLRLSTKYELKYRSTTSRPNFLRKLGSSSNTTTEESINSTEKLNDKTKKINQSSEDDDYEEEEEGRSFAVVTKYTTNNRSRESIVRPNLVRTRLPISYTTTEKSFAENRSTTSRTNFFRKPSQATKTQSVNSTEKENDNIRKPNQSDEYDDYEDEIEGKIISDVKKYTTSNRNRVSVGRPSFIKTKSTIISSSTEDIVAENQSSTSRPNFFRKKIVSSSQATKEQSDNSTEKDNENTKKTIQSNEDDDYEDEEEGSSLAEVKKYTTNNRTRVINARPNVVKTNFTLNSSSTEKSVAENRSATARPNFFKKPILSSSQTTKEQSVNSTEKENNNIRKGIQSDEDEDYEDEDEGNTSAEVKKYTTINRSRISSGRPSLTKTNFPAISSSTEEIVAANRSKTSRPNFFRKPTVSSNQDTTESSEKENDSTRKTIQSDEDEDYEKEEEGNSFAEIKNYTANNRSRIPLLRPNLVKTNFNSSSTEEIVTENQSATSRPNFFKKPILSSRKATQEQSVNSTDKENDIQSDGEEDYDEEDEEEGSTFAEAKNDTISNRTQAPIVRPSFVKTNFPVISSSTEETVAENRSTTSRPNFFRKPTFSSSQASTEQSVNSTEKVDDSTGKTIQSDDVEDYEEEEEGNTSSEVKNDTSTNRSRVPIGRQSFVKTNFTGNSRTTEKNIAENRSTASRPNFFRKPTLSSNQNRTDQSVISIEAENDSTRKTIQSDKDDDYDEEEEDNTSAEVKKYTTTNRSRVSIGRQSFVKSNFSVISTTEKNVSENRTTTSRPNFFRKPIISSSKSTKEQSVNSTEKENNKISHQLDEYEDYEDEEEGSSFAEVKNYTTNNRNRVPFIKPNLVKTNFISSSTEEIVAKNQSTTSRPNFFKRPILSSSQATQEQSVNSTEKENDNTRKTIQSDEDEDYEEEEVKKYTTTSRSRVPIIRPNFIKTKFPIISSTTEKSVGEKLDDDDYDEDDTYDDYDEDEIKQPVTPRRFARPTFATKPNLKNTPSTTTKVIESSEIDNGDEDTNTSTRPTISKFKFSRPPSFRRPSISQSGKEPTEPTNKESNLDQNEDTNKDQANITTISSNTDNSTIKNSNASLLKYARKPTSGFIPHSVKSTNVSSTSTELKEPLTKQRFNFQRSKTVLTSAKNDSKDDNKNEEDDFNENYDEDDVNVKEDSYDEYDDYDSENPEKTDISVNKTTNSDASSKTETFKPRLNLFQNPKPYPLQHKEIESVKRNNSQILTENLNLLSDNNTISQSNSVNFTSTESKNPSGIESDNNLLDEINFKTVEHDNNTTPESRSFINFTRRFQKRPAALNISEVQNTTDEQSTIKNFNGRRVRVFKVRKPAANLLTNDTNENSEITISKPVTASPASSNFTRRKIIRKKPVVITTSESSINETDTITSTTPIIPTTTTRKTIRKVIRKLRPLSERNSTINAEANTNLTNIVPIDESTGLSNGNINSTDLNLGILRSENDTQNLDFFNKTEINEEFENNENATDVQDYDSASDSPNTTKSKLFVSRRPYRPTKPSVQALTSTESTASTPRNYVRKYSSTFILPKPPAELGGAINQETGGVFVRPPNVNRFKTPPKTGISGISIKEDADVYDEDVDGEDYDDDDDDDEDEDDDEDNDDIEDDNDTNEGPNIELENKKPVPEVILNKPNYFLLNRNKQTDETANVDRLENTHREQNANINQTKIFSPSLAPNLNNRPYVNINRAPVPTLEDQSNVNNTYTTITNGFFNTNSNIDNTHDDQDDKEKTPVILPNEQLKKPNSPIFGRRPNQPSYKPPRPTNKPRLANSPILTTVRPSSQRVGVTKTSLNTTPSNFRVTNTRSYERKYSTSSTETVPQENVLLEDLNIDALNARNKKIFQINSKKHTTVRPKTTLSDATIANTTETTLNTDLHEEHNITFDENNHNIDTFQENVLESSLPQTTTPGPFEYTTPSKMTTLQHIFSLDDYGSTVMPNEQEERVTKEKSEKLVEISRTVEIYSKQHKHTIKANGNETRSYKSTDLKLEQLPTVDKLGEINRITLVKLVESGRSNQETGRSSNSHNVLVDGQTTPIVDYPATELIPQSPFVRNSIPEVDAEAGQKQGRKLLLPELIFSVETSTIPLEGLFETSRQSKNIKPSFGPVYASSLGEVHTSQLIDDRFDTTTESATKPPEVEVEETKTEKPVNYVRPLVPLLRPESNESSPLVISIANLDKVILSKVPKQDVASSGRIDVFVEAPQTNSPVDVAINTSSTNNNKHTENTFVETLTSYSSEINHVRKKVPRKPKSSQPVESSSELL